MLRSRHPVATGSCADAVVLQRASRRLTGAGRGLGRKIAERLARRQIHVVCTDIDEGAHDRRDAAGNLTGYGRGAIGTSRCSAT